MEMYDDDGVGPPFIALFVCPLHHPGFGVNLSGYYRRSETQAMT